MKNTPRRLLLAALALPLLATAVSAQTVGYWRFEDGNFLADSSGNGFTLTNNNSGTGGNNRQDLLPSTGPGSDFFNPIPQTGATNTAVAFKGSNATQARYFSVADNAAFTSNTFTLEALAHIVTSSTTSDIFLAGQVAGAGDQRSYAIYLETDASREFRLALSSNGTSTEFVNSGLSYQVGKDYYFGVSVNMADTSAAGITFYLQNLTDGGPLQTASIAHTATSLFNSSTAFAIGAQGDGGSSANWSGFIDEVRLSNVALGQNDLLITAIPEPSSAAALLGLGALGAVVLRRRRSAV